MTNFEVQTQEYLFSEIYQRLCNSDHPGTIIRQQQCPNENLDGKILMAKGRAGTFSLISNQEQFTLEQIESLVRSGVDDLLNVIKEHHPTIFSLYQVYVVRYTKVTGNDLDPILQIVDPDTYEVKHDHGTYCFKLKLRYAMWPDGNE